MSALDKQEGVKINWKPWRGQHEAEGFTFNDGEFSGGVYDYDGDGVEIKVYQNIGGKWRALLTKFYSGLADDDIEHGKQVIEKLLTHEIEQPEKDPIEFHEEFIAATSEG